MKIIFNNRNLSDINEIRTYINRKTVLCFSRNQSKIKTVSITLADINGPKGGKDKQCKIRVITNNIPEIVITEERENLLHAIDRSLMRANRTLVQQLKRRQNLLQGGAQHHLSRQLVSDHAEQISA